MPPAPSSELPRPGRKRPPVFPSWTDLLFRTAVAVAVIGLVYAIALVGYGLSARTLNAGYMPLQPVPYSHRVHVGELGLDCRYCHSTVERTARANVPPTSTCMNCHMMVLPDSEKLERVWYGYQRGAPIRWIRVHDLPDYVYFDHSAHVSHGVGCASCHGRVDTMEEVFQVEPLSMAWCLDCHRDPAPHIRPASRVTDMEYVPDREEGARLLQERGFDDRRVRTLTSCSTCHR